MALGRLICRLGALWLVLDGLWPFSLGSCCSPFGRVGNVVAAIGLLQRQNPVNDRFQVVVADLVNRVGHHRDLSPIAGTASAYLVKKMTRGLGVAFVFGGDILVGRSNPLLVHGVAGDTTGFFHDGFPFGRAGRVGDSQGECCDDGQQGKVKFFAWDGFLVLNEPGRLQFGPFVVGKQT